jgi:Spy/CpxP family protein refolding chaperone
MARKTFLARLAAFLVVQTCVLLAATPVIAQEQTRQKGRANSEWWTTAKAKQGLTLTDDQIARIAEIEDGTRRPRQEAARNQRRAYRETIMGLAEGALSDEELKKHNEAIEQASIDATRVTLDYWGQLRGVLSREQWEQLPKVAPHVLRLGGMITRGFERVDVAEPEGE